MPNNRSSGLAGQLDRVSMFPSPQEQQRRAVELSRSLRAAGATGMRLFGVGPLSAAASAQDDVRRLTGAAPRDDPNEGFLRGQEQLVRNAADQVDIDPWYENGDTRFARNVMSLAGPRRGLGLAYDTFNSAREMADEVRRRKLDKTRLGDAAQLEAGAAPAAFDLAKRVAIARVPKTIRDPLARAMDAAPGGRAGVELVERVVDNKAQDINAALVKRELDRRTAAVNSNSGFYQDAMRNAAAAGLTMLQMIMQPGTTTAHYLERLLLGDK